MDKTKNFRFSKDKLDNLPLPIKDRDTYTDTIETALRLRVGKTGVKAFILFRK